MSKRKIQEIEDILGKKMPYTEGIRLKDEMELRYNVTITVVPHQPLTVGPEGKVLIFSDYKINR